MSLNEAPTFSLVDGGAMHQLLSRSLGRPSRREYHFVRAAAVCVLVSWLPLFILSIIQGLAWGDSVTIPLLYDIASYTRFFVAMPMLVIAESIIGPKLAEVAAHLLRSGRIAEGEYAKYREAIDEAVHLRDSRWAEVAVLVIAYISTVATMMAFAAKVSNWRWTMSDGAIHYTLAAWWYLLISIPIFQFLLYRWFLRMFIWSRFLYRISRLNLQLVATHPDRVGGLGFVGSNQRFFWMILFSLGSVFAGVYGNEIIYQGVELNSIRVPMLIVAALLVFLIQVPALFFIFMLLKTKRSGIFVYGTLALQYTSDFQEKWINQNKPPGEQLMGSSDVQSLADLGNSYSVIEAMRVVPFSLRSSIWLAAAFIVPFLPLQLTVMPLEEILETILKLIA